MKYKRYLLFLIITMILGLNKIYALETTDKCYYIGNELKATFSFGPNHQEAYINVLGNKLDHDEEDMLNWRPDILRGNKTAAGYKITDLYSSLSHARKNGKCPTYIVIQKCKVYSVWGTNDYSEAVSATQGINSVSGCVGRYGSDLNGAGNRITSEEYYSSLLIDVDSGGHKIICDPSTDTNCDPTQSCNAIFGKVDDAGGTDANGNEVPPSVAYIINQLLTYVRIIVPILIILLGSLDLAKAVVASKEDEMRKAQTRFVKRIIAGIIVFFVPTIVNLIMKLADIAWEGLGYYTCTYK